MALAQVADEHGFGVEVVDRDIEEPLDLRGVEVHGEDAADAGGGEQVGDEFGGDGDARLVLAVLAGVAEERHHGGDALGAGAACGIHHDQQLHDVVVGRRAARLDDEDILAADVFIDFDEGFAIGKCGDLDVGERLAEAFGDALGERAVGGSTDEFHGEKRAGCGGAADC